MPIVFLLIIETTYTNMIKYLSSTRFTNLCCALVLHIFDKQFYIKYIMKLIQRL